MYRLIAAIDRKQGMAKQGFQPWYLPADEERFTELTKSDGGICLIGSTTFKTFKQGPLAERQNYVLTHDQTPIEGVTLVHDLDKFLKDFADTNVWIIGGANVFAQVVEMSGSCELYLTHIEADFGCNQFFPDYSHGFQMTEQSGLHEQNGFIFTYAHYTKTVT
jgi:dihydrofolate reductase